MGFPHSLDPKKRSSPSSRETGDRDEVDDPRTRGRIRGPRRGGSGCRTVSPGSPPRPVDPSTPTPPSDGSRWVDVPRLDRAEGGTVDPVTEWETGRKV